MKMSAGGVVLFFIGLAFVFVFGIWNVMEDYEVNRNKEDFIRTSNFFFEGRIQNTKKLTPIYSAILISIDSLNFDKHVFPEPNSPFFNGLYSSDNNAIIFLACFDNECVPEDLPTYIEVSSQLNSVHFDKAINPDTNYRITKVYVNSLLKYAKEIGGNDWAGF
jgi:hypothetical protein